MKKWSFCLCLWRRWWHSAIKSRQILKYPSEAPKTKNCSWFENAWCSLETLLLCTLWPVFCREWCRRKWEKLPWHCWRWRLRRRYNANSVTLWVKIQTLQKRIFLNINFYIDLLGITLRQLIYQGQCFFNPSIKLFTNFQIIILWNF